MNAILLRALSRHTAEKRPLLILWPPTDQISLGRLETKLSAHFNAYGSGSAGPEGSLQSLLELSPCVPQLGSTIEDEPLGLR
jgi:hypothetical protein